MIHTASPQSRPAMIFRFGCTYLGTENLCENSDDQYQPRGSSTAAVRLLGQVGVEVGGEGNNDPLGQTHSPANSGHYSHLKVILFCEI